MTEGAGAMAESSPIGLVPTSLVPAAHVAEQTPARKSANGINFASFADNGINSGDLERMVQAVPVTIAAALANKIYYFVPLVLAASSNAEASGQPPGPSSGHRTSHDEPMVSPTHTPELAELAICHRNVDLPSLTPGSDNPTEGVFISSRLLSDRFSLAFEFFINVGHAFVDAAGVPETFNELAWNQALADVRGETSQDAWETRNLALTGGDAASHTGKPRIDEKAKTEFLEAAFADAVAIYLLSLAVDFDYSELREREYPLLAPQSLAERLRLTARLFPPNPAYDFAIRYRRRT
jgi:hypothetical protein